MSIGEGVLLAGLCITVLTLLGTIVWKVATIDGETKAIGSDVKCNGKDIRSLKTELGECITKITTLDTSVNGLAEKHAKHDEECDQDRVEMWNVLNGIVPDRE